MDGALGPVADYSTEINCFYEGNNLLWSNPISSSSGTLSLSINENQAVEIKSWPNPSSGAINLSLQSELV